MPDLDWYAESLLERSPSEYLRERLRVLAVTSANSEKVNEMAAEGAKFGELDLRSKSVDVEVTGSEMSAGARFALMDSAVLLHQTAETLWLWFLACQAETPAPWFSIPSTTPAKLQGRIDSFKGAPVERRNEDVGRAFVDALRPGLAQPGQRTSESAAAVAELRKLMAWFAEHVSSADAYNGIKHGSAAIAGRQAMSLEVAGETIEWASGESLIVLRRDGRPDQGREPWKLEQRWYSLEVCLAGTTIGCSLLDLIWQRCRHRARGRGVREMTAAELAGLNVEVLKKLSEDHSATATRRFILTPDPTEIQA